uniref:G-protein coupled receptors family 1 profile domain-containing protein n=1 Tax=Strongyloides stercoralis TaxID=6248 RepID=A0A0K0EJC1_STRER
MQCNKGLIFFIIAIVIIILCSVIGNILYFDNYNDESRCFTIAYNTSGGKAGLYFLHIGNILSIIFFIFAIISLISKRLNLFWSLLIICILRIIVNISGIVLLAIALTNNNCNSGEAIAGLAINMIGIFVILISFCFKKRSNSRNDECTYS